MIAYREKRECRVMRVGLDLREMKERQDFKELRDNCHGWFP